MTFQKICLFYKNISIRGIFAMFINFDGNLNSYALNCMIYSYKKNVYVYLVDTLEINLVYFFNWIN